MHTAANRRCFVAGLAGTAAALRVGSTPSIADEGPPETATVRLPSFFPASCEIPEYIASDLLRAEGLTDVRYVSEESGDSSLKSRWVRL